MLTFNYASLRSMSRAYSQRIKPEYQAQDVQTVGDISFTCHKIIALPLVCKAGKYSRQQIKPIDGVFVPGKPRLVKVTPCK